MTTLPEQITDLLSNSNLTSNLQGQVGMITDAAKLLTNLIANPPDEIGDLVAGLDGTTISSIRIPDALTQNFSALADIIPDDLSSVTEELDDILENFGTFANEETLAGISSYVACLQAVADLLTIDLSLFDFGSQNSSVSSSTASSADSSSGFSADADSGSSSGGSGSGVAPRDSSSGTDSSSGNGDETTRTKNLETLCGMRGVLDTFPYPFDAENVVKFLSAKLKGVPRHFINMSHVPIYDDLDQLLDTMIRFADMDNAAALQTHIQSTLTALRVALERDGQAPLSTLAASFNNLSAKIDFTSLHNEMSQLATALQNIADAVEAADISGIDSDVNTINSALDSLLPRLNQMLNDVFSGDASQSITQLTRLPRELDLAMRRLQRMLQPSVSLDFFIVIDSLLNQGIEHSNLNELTQAIADFFQRITGALEMLNSATIKTSLGTVSDALESALDDFDDAMLQLAARVSALFDEVDAALAQIDTQSLREQVEQAIEELQNSLEKTVNDLFEPVRSAVSSAVATIETTVSSFDPDDVAEVLRGVITQITDVLTSEEVTNAINNIRDAIDRVTRQVQALSFSPIVDEVIDGIDHITETLQGIEPSQLNAVTKGAIKIAVEVLPDDLEEPRNYLVTELDRIVDEGPVPLIEQIKAPVEQLTNQVQSLSPEKLIGDSLSKPFNDFIAELDKFTPSSLLLPVQNALDNVKGNVRDQIDLARLLKPLEDLYDNLVSQMDRFGPEQLVDPIEQQITSLVDNLLEVLPEEVIFEVLDKIISGIEFVTDIVTEVKLIAQKIRDMIAALANPEDQLRNWLQPVLNLIDTMPDIASLQTLFDDVSEAVAKLTAAELQATLHSSTDPLINALADLQPQVLLTQLTSAYQDIDRAAVNALPDSLQKSALLAALDRFNPLSPPMSRVFSNLEQWDDDLSRALTAYETAMLNWDVRFFVEGNPFSALQIPDVTTQTIKDLLREGIEEQAIAPISKILSSIGNAITAFNGPIGELENFVDSIEDMLEEITQGPDSLGEIQDTLNQLIERVRNINLQFLEDELNEVFEAVKQKFNDVSPTVFREALQTAIDETLDLIDISLLLPQEDINAIDQTYQDLLSTLKTFDPSKLVIDAVKPEFDSKILPLIDKFDLSKPLDTLIERMDNMAKELGSELSRTDQSYQTMLQAMPI